MYRHVAVIKLHVEYLLPARCEKDARNGIFRELISRASGGPAVAASHEAHAPRLLLVDRFTRCARGNVFSLITSRAPKVPPSRTPNYYAVARAQTSGVSCPSENGDLQSVFRGSSRINVVPSALYFHSRGYFRTCNFYFDLFHLPTLAVFIIVISANLRRILITRAKSKQRLRI